MNPEVPDAIASDVAFSEADDDMPRRTYWWSLHRPETYALASVLIGVITLMSFGSAQEIAQAIVLSNPTRNQQQTYLFIVSGIRLAIALVAIMCAVLSIVSEDEDTTWSPPVARAGLLLAGLAAVLALAALITGIFISDPNPNF